MDDSKKKDDSIKPRAENLSTLALKYGVSHKTMKSWLVRAKLYKEKHKGYLYTPKEVAKIYEHLGNP